MVVSRIACLSYEQMERCQGMCGRGPSGAWRLELAEKRCRPSSIESRPHACLVYNDIGGIYYTLQPGA
ncbi:hypothetical protein MRX96_047770 [Rhipicephalus microplus]